MFGAGVIVPGTLLPIGAYMVPSTNQEFSDFVGWANILALTVSALGASVVAFEKMKAVDEGSDFPSRQLIDKIASKALREQAFLLSQLLGTDSLEMQPALIKFRIQSPNNRRTTNKKKLKQVKSMLDIEGYFTNDCRGRLVILGAPGSGKTVLSTWLSVQLLKAIKRDQDRKITGIPMPLDITTWDPRKNLEDWMAGQVRKNYQLSKKQAWHLVESGVFIPFVDSLDEIDSEQESLQRSMMAVQKINEYIARTPDAKIVVVSRSGERYYEKLSRRIKHSSHVEINSLNPSEVTEYIRSQIQGEIDEISWEPFLKELRGKRSQQVAASFGTPWRLTAAISFYLNGGDPRELLPRQIEEGRDRSGKKSYEKRVSMKLMESFLVSRSKIYSGSLPEAEVLAAQLSSLAIIIRHGQRKGLGSGINLHEWWKVVGPLKVPLFQGLLITQVLGLIFSAWVRIVENTQLDYPEESPLPLWSIIAFYAAIKIYAGLVFARRVAPVAFTFPRFHSWKLRIAFFGAMTFALVSALASVHTAGYIYATAMFLSYSAIFILAFSVVPSILKPGAVSPESPLVDDLRFCFVMGISIALASVTYFLTIFDLPLALTYACMAFAASILCSFYVRNLMTQLLAVGYGLPLRFTKFLQECQRAGILRSSGFSYKFRSNELEAYLLRS